MTHLLVDVEVLSAKLATERRGSPEAWARYSPVT
jgi:hypothetical protein